MQPSRTDPKSAAERKSVDEAQVPAVNNDTPPGLKAESSCRFRNWPAFLEFILPGISSAAGYAHARSSPTRKLSTGMSEEEARTVATYLDAIR